MACQTAEVDNGRVDEEANVLAFPQAPEAIELRHLRAFVAVAEELNFGRAAERLYITQPALSRQIRALEQLLGCELLRRSTHRVELTIAGEALLARTRPLLREVDAAVSAAQSVGGELAGRVARLWEPVIQATVADADLQEQRMAYEAMHAQFSLPPEVEVRAVNAHGVPSLLVARQPDDPPTLLYLHGGGYVLGSAFGYRPLVGAVSAYRWMLERGVDAGQVTMAGDSSGGGLVVSLLVRLKELGLPQPGGAILFCPWVDLALELAERRTEEARVVARAAAAAYLAGHPAEDPVVSPLGADLTGLAPLLIQAATGDAHLADAEALTDHATRHGVDARLELYPVDAHVFQFFWSFLPDAAEAIQAAGRFAGRVRAPGSSQAGSG